jgi:hypothetical protein
VCESLPLDIPEPWRLGNEQLCDSCRNGRCERCTARQSRAAWCEHPYCFWIPYVPPYPRRPK